jgi:acetyl-CoA carboxylase carboxyltransferase component
MAWEKACEELARRTARAREMGGAERVARQHAAGRLTVRERLERLLDPGSFQEIGALAGQARYDENGELVGFTPANPVLGLARIGGLDVVVSGDDFTLRGGSADASLREKAVMAERLALRFRLPLVRLIEGSGGGGSVKTIETTGRANLPGGVGGEDTFALPIAALQEVPVIALGLGPVAGLGAVRLAASHVSIMTENAAVFVAGPPVVARLGRSVDNTTLGGPEIAARAGTVDLVAEDEEAAFALTRRLLTYFPPHAAALPPETAPAADPAPYLPALREGVPEDPRRVYDMRRLIGLLVDAGSFLELARAFGRSVIAGLARIDGLPVMLLAGDPYHYGGAWTAESAEKIIRFVDLARLFHFPVVHLVDCPGFMIGPEAERAGTVRRGARAWAAIAEAVEIPWCTVIIRNAFGVAGALHQPPGPGALRFAWPSARWGSLPLEGGVEAAYRAEIEAAPDPEAKRAEIAARLERLRSPFRTAEAFWIEEIIDPAETRARLIGFARLARRVLTPPPPRYRFRP